MSIYPMNRIGYIKRYGCMPQGEPSMTDAILDAIKSNRPFYWIKSRVPHGLTMISDWKPLND